MSLNVPFYCVTEYHVICGWCNERMSNEWANVHRMTHEGWLMGLEGLPLLPPGERFVSCGEAHPEYDVYHPEGHRHVAHSTPLADSAPNSGYPRAGKRPDGEWEWCYEDDGPDGPERQVIHPHTRLSIPGSLCVHCDTVMGQSLVCSGCDWIDPLTRKRRLLNCVEEWPECETGMYDPRCCRFPKSCSCTIYDSNISEDKLEP